MNIDEQSLMRTFIRCASLVLVVVILTAGGCNMQQNYVVQEAITHGVDPVRVSCAFTSDNEARLLCVNSPAKATSTK